MAEVGRLFPEARDYLDCYERAGGLGSRTILAHAIHLSADEVQRLVASGSGVAHCPASNLFLSSGMMRLSTYRAAGMKVGLGSDVAAGPDVSIFGAMRAGSVTQRVLELTGATPREGELGPIDWLRVGSLDAARVLGLDDRIGSLEGGKEADMIAVDPRFTTPLPDDDPPSEADDLASRLIFRSHPNMVRAAWVRGRVPGRAAGARQHRVGYGRESDHRPADHRRGAVRGRLGRPGAGLQLRRPRTPGGGSCWWRSSSGS